MKLSSSTILIVTASLLLGVLATLMFLQCNNFNKDEIATISNGFNGLLTPFISLGAAVLVFLSFKEQTRANYIISSQWQYDLLLRLVDSLENNYSNLKLQNTTVNGTYVYRGEDTFKQLRRSDWEFDNLSDILTDFHTILWELLFVIDRIESAKIENKDYLRLRCSVFYVKKIEKYITYLRTEIVNDRRRNFYSEAMVDIISKLQARAFSLRKSGVWGG